jgi:hypothetical protein
MAVWPARAAYLFMTTCNWKRTTLPHLVRVLGYVACGGSWVAAEWVVGGDFDENDPDAVGVLDPHLGQSPWLGYWLAQDVDSGCCQAFVFGVNIPYLEPDHQRTVPGVIGLPGDFQQALAEEEHQPGAPWGPNSR